MATGEVRHRNVENEGEEVINKPLLIRQSGGLRHVSEEISPRFYAPGLLLFGAGSCIVGFISISIIGVIDFYGRVMNESLRTPYPSGNGYFPATVSEMVHNQESPGGRVFHTFGMMAGVCIFTSWYPIHLRNVYTGADHLPLIRVYWTTCRQIVPPMGLWLLIGVNTYPGPVAINSVGHTKLACVFLHLVGAGMLFVGYLVCEMKCLGLCLFRAPKATKDVIKPRERFVRVLLSWTILAFFTLFCGLQVTLAFSKQGPDKSLICCMDKWAFKGDEVTTWDGRNMTIMASPQIVDTATGSFLKLKIASFVCEDAAGLAVVLSHLAVWYFCEERHKEHGSIELEPILDTADVVVSDGFRADVVDLEVSDGFRANEKV